MWFFPTTFNCFNFRRFSWENGLYDIKSEIIKFSLDIKGVKWRDDSPTNPKPDWAKKKKYQSSNALYTMFDL